VNAMLEGVGFNLRWIFENFKRDFGFQPSKIRAIGGGSVNEGWMQGIANITGLEVETVDNPTMAGALGVATCVFVAEGILDSFSEVKAFIKQKATFQPDLEQKELYEKLFCSYKAIYKGLKKAYAQANLERFNTTN
jgi:xylulokinase